VSGLLCQTADTAVCQRIAFREKLESWFDLERCELIGQGEKGWHGGTVAGDVGMMPRARGIRAVFDLETGRGE